MNSPPENNSSNTKSLVVIGFGDLARRLQAHLTTDGWRVQGLCRSGKTSEFAAAQKGDAASKEDLTSILASSPSQVLVTLTPDARTPQAYDSTYVQTAQALVEVCQSLAIKPHVIFVSSTAVYGQDDGSTVNEQSIAQPNRFNGQALREAEEIYERSGLPVTILRFSGIYGRAKKSLEELLRANEPGFSPHRWTNRIHVVDAVGVIEFVLRRFEADKTALGVVLASDSRAEQEGAIENWVRDQLQLPHQQFAAGNQSSGKRCDSARLRTLGYRLVVEDYRTGYLEGL